MKTFKNINFKTRDYECTNRVACQSDTNPDTKMWEECSATIIVLMGLNKLYTLNGVTYYGYL